VASNVIGGETGFDVRLFTDLSVPKEVALFLLVNEKQKRVRTDLGVRVVQRQLDEGSLTDDEQAMLNTVVPDTEAWKYDASRIAGRLNVDADSAWQGMIQMPGDSVTKPIKLQAFWTSLKPVLDDPDLKARLNQMQINGDLGGRDATEFLLTVLKNFWGAVADVNADAHAEPATNVLWGSIGVNACHLALARVAATLLSADHPDMRRHRFVEMVKESQVVEYDFWYSRPGNLRAEYPGGKGDATTMTGGSGYLRLAGILEKEWRAALHAAGTSRAVAL
jgi:hypothetical protein